MQGASLMPRRAPLPTRSKGRQTPVSAGFPPRCQEETRHARIGESPSRRLAFFMRDLDSDVTIRVGFPTRGCHGRLRPCLRGPVSGAPHGRERPWHPSNMQAEALRRRGAGTAREQGWHPQAELGGVCAGTSGRGHPQACGLGVPPRRVAPNANANAPHVGPRIDRKGSPAYNPHFRMYALPASGRTVCPRKPRSTFTSSVTSNATPSA